jgi:quercetin dioxygenase-like cupin family protein
MEAIFSPGMTAPEHTHSGPEAWYTLSGEACLETSDGRVQIGRAGGSAVIVPMGLSTHLTTGKEQRRAHSAYPSLDITATNLFGS